MESLILKEKVKEVDFMRKVNLNMDEQRKYEVIKRLVDENGNKDRAALTLGITKRQVYRLIKVYQEKGKAGFIHGNRGRKPATTIPDDTRRLVLDLYKTKYYEANFTHFTELLERIEGIKLSVSTVTSILEADYILSPRVTKAKQKRKKKNSRRNRLLLKVKRNRIIFRQIWSLSRMLIPGVPDALISVNWNRWTLLPMNGSVPAKLPCTSLWMMPPVPLQERGLTYRRLYPAITMFSIKYW